MSRLSLFAATLAASAFAVTGLTALPAQAATPNAGAEIIGQLGYEGGAYPGTFKPTAGTVFVQFDLRPLQLVHAVGKSGSFKLHLSPGTYTLTGCGPATSTAPVGQCGRPMTVTLVAHETDHLQLVWLMAP